MSQILTSDNENPLWPCSPRNSAAGEARRQRAESSRSQIAEGARPTIALADGHRTAARGLLNARLQSSASRRNRREGNFSSPQTLGNKRNRFGLPPAPPVRRTPMRRRPSLLASARAGVQGNAVAVALAAALPSISP